MARRSRAPGTAATARITRRLAQSALHRSNHRRPRVHRRCAGRSGGPRSGRARLRHRHARPGPPQHHPARHLSRDHAAGDDRRHQPVRTVSGARARSALEPLPDARLDRVDLLLGGTRRSCGPTGWMAARSGSSRARVWFGRPSAPCCSLHLRCEQSWRTPWRLASWPSSRCSSRAGRGASASSRRSAFTRRSRPRSPRTSSAGRWPRCCSAAGNPDDRSPSSQIEAGRSTGAQGQSRTVYTWIFSPLLYQLSYLGR